LEKSLLSHAGKNHPPRVRFTGSSPGFLANQTGAKPQSLCIDFVRKDFNMARLQYATQIETSSRFNPDARADHGTRRITLTPNAIHIERSLNGMKMRLQVSAKLYQGVALLVQDRPEGTIYELKLAHRDAELGIFLEALSDKQEAEDRQRQWAVFFARPALDNAFAPIESEDQNTIFLSAPRRRCMTTVAKRRPRRLARRKAGNRENLGIVRQGEREIICYE
jgi:hypothetical protein